MAKNNEFEEMFPDDDFNKELYEMMKSILLNDNLSEEEFFERMMDPDLLLEDMGIDPDEINLDDIDLDDISLDDVDVSLLSPEELIEFNQDKQFLELLKEKNSEMEKIEDDKFIKSLQFKKNASLVEQFEEVELVINHYTPDWLANNPRGWLATSMDTFYEMKKELAIQYFELGMFGEALKQFSELEQKEHDIDNHHYIMMSYSILGDWDKGTEYFMSDSIHANDEMMLIAYLVLAIKTRQKDLASNLFDRLWKINHNLYRYYATQEQSALDVDCMMNKEMSDQVQKIIDVFERMVDHLPRMFFDVFFEYLFSFKPYEEMNFLRFDPMIQRTQLMRLASVGIYIYDDFKYTTKDEILSLKGVGPKTVQYLEENGVKFKK